MAAERARQEALKGGCSAPAGSAAGYAPRNSIILSDGDSEAESSEGGDGGANGEAEGGPSGEGGVKGVPQNEDQPAQKVAPAALNVAEAAGSATEAVCISAELTARMKAHQVTPKQQYSSSAPHPAALLPASLLPPSLSLAVTLVR